jgi:hypothetical protein
MKKHTTALLLALLASSVMADSSDYLNDPHLDPVMAQSLGRITHEIYEQGGYKAVRKWLDGCWGDADTAFEATMCAAFDWSADHLKWGWIGTLWLGRSERMTKTLGHLPLATIERGQEEAEKQARYLEAGLRQPLDK